jgi:hypothetical protein
VTCITMTWWFYLRLVHGEAGAEPRRDARLAPRRLGPAAPA